MLRIADDPAYRDDDVVAVDLAFLGTFFFLMTPTAARSVLLEQSDAFPQRYSIDLFKTLELDRGIVYAQGERHKENKRACLPAFEAASSMATFQEAIREECDAACRRWQARIDASGGAARFDVYQEARKLTLAVILRVTFGLRVDNDDSDDSLSSKISETIAAYLEAIVACANEPIVSVAPQLSSNYRRVVGEGGLLMKLRELVLTLIAERRRVAPTVAESSGAAPSGDLLGVLLASGTRDEDILVLLFDVVIAGSDTTASTIAASVFLSSRDAALMERVRAEPNVLDAALEDLRVRHPALTAIARETLRLYPPVPFVGRRSVVAADVCGYALPRGAVCCWSPWLLGRDARNGWSSAGAYDPAGVWLEGGGAAPDPFAWLPFGAGVRGCLGTRLGLTETVLGTVRRRLRQSLEDWL